MRDRPSSGRAHAHGYLPYASSNARVAVWRHMPTGAFKPIGAVLRAIALVVILCALLDPGLVFAHLSHWVNLAFWSTRAGGMVAVVLAALAMGLYLPAVLQNKDKFALWLVTGVWLALDIAAIAQPFTGARYAEESRYILNASFLLLAYAFGLIGARLLPDLRNYIVVLVACGAVKSIIAILLLIASNQASVPNVLRDQPLLWMLQSPKDLASYPVFLLPFAVSGILTASRPTSRVFYMLSTAVMVAALLISRECSAAAAGVVGLLWLARNRLEGRRPLAVLALTLALVFAVMYVRTGGPLTVTGFARSVDTRFQLVRKGAEVFGQQWWAGVGIGHEPLSMQITPAHPMEPEIFADPQSQYLLFLDQMGLVGGLLLLGFGRFAWRAVRSTDARWKDVVASSWLSLAFAGVFITLFGLSTLSSGNILFATLVGITMRLGDSSSASAQRT